MSLLVPHLTNRAPALVAATSEAPPIVSTSSSQPTSATQTRAALMAGSKIICLWGMRPDFIFERLQDAKLPDAKITQLEKRVVACLVYYLDDALTALQAELAVRQAVNQ